MIGVLPRRPLPSSVCPGGPQSSFPFSLIASGSHLLPPYSIPPLCHVEFILFVGSLSDQAYLSRSVLRFCQVNCSFSPFFLTSLPLYYSQFALPIKFWENFILILAIYTLNHASILIKGSIKEEFIVIKTFDEGNKSKFKNIAKFLFSNLKPFRKS